MSTDYVETLTRNWELHIGPRHPKAPTVISLFAGAGGSSLGYSMAGYNELMAVEWDKDIASILSKNFPRLPVFCGDISKLSSDYIFNTCDIRKGELSVLDGSPPCQGFSVSGKRKFDDPRNQLFKEFIRLLKDLNPMAFVMENVAGLVRGKMKLIFTEILRSLKDCGYKVRCQLMNARYFNVPQNRERTIFVGIRDDIDTEPGHPQAEAKPLSVYDAIGNLLSGKPGRHPTRLVMAWQKAKYGQSLREVDPTVDSNQVIKLDPRKPSPTQTTGRPNWHWKIARRLSIKEAAVLQSFPLEYRWTGSKGKVLKGIGNSVPPLFMKAIASHVRKLLRL